MLLPNKYLTLEESCLGISAFLLSCLENKKMTLEQLWEKFKKKYSDKLGTKFPDYQKFVFTIDFMYMVDMISYNQSGEIFNENFVTQD